MAEQVFFWAMAAAAFVAAVLAVRFSVCMANLNPPSFLKSVAIVFFAAAVFGIAVSAVSSIGPAFGPGLLAAFAVVICLTAGALYLALRSLHFRDWRVAAKALVPISFAMQSSPAGN